MKHIEGHFEGVRKIDIYWQAWLPEGKPKAVILVVHGLGEHSGRYMNVVNRLVPRGYAVYGFDHIGHGKSGGAREMVNRFEDYTDTLTIFDGMVKSWQAGKPIILLGHSMGGLIAAWYLIDHSADYRGAILSAPAIKVSNVSPTTILMGKMLAVLAPTVGVLPVIPGDVSRDPEVVRAYAEDPLVFHRKTPARLAAELYKATLRVGAEAGKITLPFITLQGGGDKIVDPGAAQMLYDLAGSKKKTIKTYPGLYHEVFNAPLPERERVLKDVEEWLEANV